MPAHWSWSAIQLTDVPTNVKLAFEPAFICSFALPPLWTALLLTYHEFEYCTAGLSCSTRNRVPVGVGGAGAGAGVGAPMSVAGIPDSTSNASTQIHAPPEPALFRPVASIATVWEPEGKLEILYMELRALKGAE